MAVHRWNTALEGEFSEAALRAKLEGLGYHIARYVYPPGTVFPDHKHGIDKIDAVVSGTFRLVIGGHVAVLGPGDTVTVRGGTHQDSRTPALDVVVLGGAPIREPIAMYGPFVMNTREEVRDAFTDFQAGRLGSIPAQRTTGAPTAAVPHAGVRGESTPEG